MNRNEQKTFEYKGYTIIQNGYNYHCIIEKDSNFIGHVSYAKELTQESAKSLIESIEKLLKDI